MRRLEILGLLALLWALPANAHQPVQDMAPRWAGGYGGQIRHEYRSADDLLDGSSDAANPLGRRERVHTTWLEAVYTFERSIRITAKLPFVDQDRVTRTGPSQSRTGLGDAILAMPLKRYWNEGSETGNLGFTPSVRLPTGSTGGAYPVGDGSLDFGASLSYSRETPRFYEFVDLFYWSNGKGRRGMHRGDELGLDVNLGTRVLHSNARSAGALVMWDLRLRYESRGRGSSGTTGGKRVETGPVGVVYWDNWMLRAEYRVPVYERVWSTQLGSGSSVSLSLGVAF